ncbi:MAG TPA: hypothetical protein VF746_26540 [Longimicrobium sp.]|jgi:hypothetical protein
MPDRPSREVKQVAGPPRNLPRSDTTVQRFVREDAGYRLDLDAVILKEPPRRLSIARTPDGD